MAYQRQEMTPAEVSAMRSRAAAARKNHRGGRPKLSPEEKAKRKTKSVGIPEEDYEYLRVVGAKYGLSIGGAIHSLVEVHRMVSKGK